MQKFKKSLAHGQVPTDFLLARSEKPLAPGVGRSDLSAPVLDSPLGWWGQILVCTEKAKFSKNFPHYSDTWGKK